MTIREICERVEQHMGAGVLVDLNDINALVRFVRRVVGAKAGAIKCIGGGFHRPNEPHRWTLTLCTWRHEELIARPSEKVEDGTQG